MRGRKGKLKEERLREVKSAGGEKRRKRSVSSVKVTEMKTEERQGGRKCGEEEKAKGRSWLIADTGRESAGWRDTSELHKSTNP